MVMLAINRGGITGIPAMAASDSVDTQVINMIPTIIAPNMLK